MNFRILHLVIDPENSTKEKESVENLKNFCQQFNVEYKQCVNELYKDLPPKETCNRPNDISLKLNKKGALSSAHYGCFLAHKNAICLKENKDYDFILVFEDATINWDFEDFYKNLLKFYTIMLKEDLDIFSLGSNQGQGYTFDCDKGEYLLGIHFFIPAHSYMIPKEKLKLAQFRLNNCLWDAYDLWITKVAKMKTGCSKQIFIKHCNGYSYIDDCVKIF